MKRKSRREGRSARSAQTRIAAFTPAAATEASVAWNPADGAAGARALDGTSGYDTVALEPFQKTNLALSFDGTPCWSANVLNGTLGLMLLFR